MLDSWLQRGPTTPVELEIGIVDAEGPIPHCCSSCEIETEGANSSVAGLTLEMPQVGLESLCRMHQSRQLRHQSRRPRDQNAPSWRFWSVVEMSRLLHRHHQVPAYVWASRHLAFSLRSFSCVSQAVWLAENVRRG